MKTDYITLVEREETPLWVGLVIEGCADSKAFERGNDVSFQLKHYRFIGRIHQIGAEDLQELSSAFKKKIDLDAEAYFEWYEKTCRDYCLKLLDTSEQLSSLTLPVPKVELSARLSRYFSAVKNCMPFMVSIFPVQSLIAERLSKEIEHLLTNTDLAVNSALALLSRPSAPTAVEEDSHNVSLLVKEILTSPHLKVALLQDNPTSQLEKNYPSFYQRLQEHCDRFGWLQTFTYRNRPYGVTNLIGRILDRVWQHENRLETDDIAKSQSKDIIAQQLVTIENDLTEHGSKMLQFARRYASLRFYRVDVHFMSAAKLSRLFEYAAKELGLPYELFSYLTHNEIINGLSAEGLKYHEIAEPRKKNGYDIVLGADGKAAITSPTTLEISSVSNQPLLEGTSACLGEHTGRVRIVRCSQDCVNFDRGDVLVSPMTTPEFMSAIERAGSIVTDEGGLLCHAAIISRELGIPCVIGTEIASHILKIGESVTVKAKIEKGIVYRNEF